ncbi:MAG: hypothetical protein ACFFAV_12530 [Candidatus Hermodarchaeota archaeon]
MICDVLIIKDGLPLLSKSLCNSTNIKNVFSEIDDLIMVSGFFSALNSFSDSYEDLGTISELKLSNNNLKISFLKEENIPDLIYLATYDKKSNHNDVQEILKKISDLFLKEFEIDQILKWNGRLNSFESFHAVIERIIEEEQKYEQAQYNDQVVDWIRSFEREPVEIQKKLIESESVEITPEYYNYVPIFTTAKKINPRYYLTGENSFKVYDQIDGRKSITQISGSLNIQQNQVYNICKNLIKLGFISLN